MDITFHQKEKYIVLLGKTIVIWVLIPTFENLIQDICQMDTQEFI